MTESTTDQQQPQAGDDWTDPPELTSDGGIRHGIVTYHGEATITKGLGSGADVHVQCRATVARQAEQIERLSEAIKHIGFSNSAIPGAPELAIVGVRLIKDALAALEADQ